LPIDYEVASNREKNKTNEERRRAADIISSKLGPPIKEDAVMVKIDYGSQMELCQENAERFYEDAKMLRDAESYGHAFALCILGMEEIGKKLILSTMKTGRLPQRVGLSLIHDHAWKLFDLGVSLFFAKGLDRKFEEFGLPSSSLTEKALHMHYPTLAKLKELGLYVDPSTGTNPFDPRLQSLAKVAVDTLPIYLNLVPNTGAASISENERAVIEAVLTELLTRHQLSTRHFRSARRPTRAARPAHEVV
jgi:AbiV family abortive infection protein